MYTSATLTALYGISRETVRVWVNEFREYLSPGATPSAGRQRIFSDGDMKVFALIHEMKGRGALYEDIHLALKNGQRGDLPSTLYSLAQGGTTDNRSLSLRKELEQANTKIETLETALTTYAQSDQRQKAQIELLERQIETLQTKVDNLNREIGRLEARGDIG
jgi:DNA-binding transcriptional MerR regulator